MTDCCGQPSFCEKPCFHGGKGSVLGIPLIVSEQVDGDEAYLCTPLKVKA